MVEIRKPHGLACMISSGEFSSRSLYKAIFNSTTVCEVMDIWKRKFPPKYKEFFGKWLGISIPLGNRFLRDMVRVTGHVSGACGHVIFRCLVAQFLWSVVREASGCMRVAIGFVHFHNLVQGTRGNDRKLAWVAFAALAWTL